MENPYASPSPSPFSDFSDAPKGAPPGQYPRGLVGHVRILGILMIVQGVLDLLMGVMLVGLGFAMPLFLKMEANNAKPPPPEIEMFMVGTYIGLGALTLIVAVLNCWSGWQVIHFRQRKLGIVAVSAGMVTMLTCYCGFTAIGLLIYGLIVLLDDSVKHAFRLAADGYTSEQIEALFNPWSQSGNWPAGPPSAT